MTYNERRRYERECRKQRLLAVLLEIEQTGENLFFADLAEKAGCPRTTARVLRDELVEEGLITSSVVMTSKDSAPLDLESRIEVVREAKFHKWLKTNRLGLTGDELDKVLP